MTRLPVHQPRTCGTCVACCTTSHVPELSKPMHARCAHVREPTGCLVYAERPASCRHFLCAWLQGHYGLTGAQRPDRLGVVVWTGESTLGPAIHVGEVEVGAMERPAVKTVVRALSERGVPVIELRVDGTQVVRGGLR